MEIGQFLIVLDVSVSDSLSPVPPSMELMA